MSTTSSVRAYSLPLCLALGVATAAAVSIVASIVFALGGGTQLAGHGLTLRNVLIAYFAGALVSPTIFWALQGLGRFKWGGALIGFFVILPVSLTAATFLPGDNYPIGLRIAAAIFAASAGGIAGYMEGGR